MLLVKDFKLVDFIYFIAVNTDQHIIIVLSNMLTLLLIITDTDELLIYFMIWPTTEKMADIKKIQ